MKFDTLNKHKSDLELNIMLTKGDELVNELNSANNSKINDGWLNIN